MANRPNYIAQYAARTDLPRGQISMHSRKQESTEMSDEESLMVPDLGTSMVTDIGRVLRIDSLLDPD